MVFLVASCGLVYFCLVFNFSFLSKKLDTAKTQKSKMQKKDKKSVSAVVFTNRVPNLGGLKELSLLKTQ